MKEEAIKALKQFGREDLIDSPYGYDIDDNIEIFMTIRQMIKYNNLQSQLKAKEEVIKEAREYVEKYDVFKEFYFPLMKRDVENQIKSSIKYEFDTSIKKNLLEILSKGENK